MDKEKGALTPAQEAIDKAAKANVEAVIKVASSAATAFVDALVKPRKARGMRGSAKKKSGSASKHGKTRRPPVRRPATITGPSKATIKTAAKKPARKGAQGRRRTPTKARGSASTKSRPGSKNRSR